MLLCLNQSTVFTISQYNPVDLTFKLYKNAKIASATTSSRPVIAQVLCRIGFDPTLAVADAEALALPLIVVADAVACVELAVTIV